MGASSDKSQQNDAAQQQIQKNTQESTQNLTNWLQANPSVLSQMKPAAPPQQFGGAFGGGVANAQQPQRPQAPGAPQLPPQILQMLAHQLGGGAPQQQGAPQQAAPPPAPGLLGLMTPRRPGP